MVPARRDQKSDPPVATPTSRGATFWLQLRRAVLSAAEGGQSVGERQAGEMTGGLFTHEGSVQPVG
jgi:hypothetical protein